MPIVASAVAAPALSSRLSADATVIPAYASAATDLLSRSGYQVGRREDLGGWASHLREAPGNTGVNPTFDPAWHMDFEPDTVFWLAITVPGGELAACMACRLFVTPSYYDLMRSGRLWYTAGKSVPIDILLEGPGPVGSVSHSGGLWVHPAHRGTGLSWILPRLVGAVAVWSWGVDYHTGIVFAGLNAKGLPDRNYGVTRNRVAIDGYFTPTGRREVIYSVETPVADIVERTAGDLAEILGHPDKQVRDFAPIASQRRDKPAVAQRASGDPSLH